MARRRKFAQEERQYWADVLIASSQITFGVAWTSLFFPLDRFKVLVVTLNLVASGILWIIGWFLIRRIK